MRDWFTYFPSVCSRLFFLKSIDLDQSLVELLVEV